MKALVLSEYKVAPALSDIAPPVAGERQVLVRVHAVGLNPVDYKTRDGKLKIVNNYALPIGMGNELSGVVDAIGPGVSRFVIGDRVFARVDKKKMGALAELAVVHENHLAKAPTSIELVHAAGVPLAALTALQALRDEIKVAPGMRLLITGGAGGVGTFAVQLAKKLGAHVTTTASSRGDALVKKLGADVVVDYTTTPLTSLPPGSFDAAFDTVGADSLTATFALVKPGGLVCSVGGMPEPLTATKDLERGVGLAVMFWLASFSFRSAARRHGVRYRYLFMHESGADLAELAAMIDAGALTVVTDRVFPFAQALEALAYLEAGRAKGKVVVQLL